MHSHILGRIQIDRDALEADIAWLAKEERPAHSYGEYVFGSWETIPLMNRTGQSNDTLFRGPVSSVKATPVLSRLPYIQAVLEDLFDVSKLMMVRANIMRDGILIPHVDYSEFPGRGTEFTRVHIPLQTDADALHSEDDCVFHMRIGEVWSLAVNRVHAACCGEAERIALCVDLSCPPMEAARDMRAVHSMAHHGSVDQRELPAVGGETMEFIDGLSRIITAASFGSVLELLSRIHFRRRVHAARTYDWLEHLCQENGDRALIGKCKAIRAYAMGRREVGERLTDRLNQ